MKILKISTFVLILSAPFSCTTNHSDPSKIGGGSNCKLEDYTLAQESKFILPYEVGKKHQIGAGNCGGATHNVGCNTIDQRCGDQRYAYDFKMTIGTPILAAFGGVVAAIEERYGDHHSTGRETNYLLIEHDDGTAAHYVHLKQKGVFVNVGDIVKQGEVVALSGNSGWVGFNNPHLHFVIFKEIHPKCNGPVREGCVSIPVTFKNADPLDTPLRFSKVYTALPDK